MNIVISGKPTGRLSSKIYKGLSEKGHSVSFCTDIFDYSQMGVLDNADVFIATAWNTKGDYKNDPINEKYAKATIKWLDECRSRNVFSIYLGTADDSGFEDCLYHRCKNKCDSRADIVLKIPYVWQPDREGSLAWKTSNGIEYNITTSENVRYVTDSEIVDRIVQCITEHAEGKTTPKQILFSEIEKKSLEYWIEKFGKDI